MRTILVLLIFVIFFLASLPLLLLLLLISCFNKKLVSRIAQPIVGCVFRLILFSAGGNACVRGIENIPDEPVLFAANHRGLFDVVVAYGFIPWSKRTAFISKQEVAKVPFLNAWMFLLRCKFLNRTDPRKGLKTIQDAIHEVSNGWSMFIMPEGTRNHESEMLPFKPGSLKIAERTGCPIVPVAIEGTDELFEKHFPWVHKGKISLTFGKPITVKGLSRDEKLALPDKVRDSIHEMFAANKNLK